MPTAAQRVLSGFTLTTPPIFFLLFAYGLLTEHVFGLSYAIGLRINNRLRIFLRAGYLATTIFAAAIMHLTLLHRCELDLSSEQFACPVALLEERACLAPVASAAVLAVVVVWTDRVFVPILSLHGLPVFETRIKQRTINAVAIMVLWFCISDVQVAAVLLLALLTARRALCLFPRVDFVYCAFLKLYLAFHMAATLAQKCDASKKLTVASVVLGTFL